MSTNRKSELIEMSKEFGLSEAYCPYCNESLVKFPSRKTRCKSCGNYIFSKKEPFSGQKRLFRQDELQLFEELTYLKNGSWDYWNNQNQEIFAAKRELSSEWGVSVDEITDGDARWRINQAKTVVAIKNQQFNELLDLKEWAIRILQSEGKKSEALRLIPECLALCYAGPSLDEEMGYPSLVDFPKKLESPQVSLFTSVESDLENIKNEFYLNKPAKAYCDVFNKSMDYVWSCFEIEVKEYRELIAGRQQEG